MGEGGRGGRVLIFQRGGRGGPQGAAELEVVSSGGEAIDDAGVAGDECALTEVGEDA